MRANGQRTVRVALLCALVVCLLAALIVAIAPQGEAPVSKTVPAEQAQHVADAADAAGSAPTSGEASTQKEAAEPNDPLSLPTDEHAFVADEPDEPFEAAAEDDVASGERVFVLPAEGASYEPGVALVHVDEGVDSQAVLDSLGSKGYVATASEVVDGMLRIELSDASELEDAVNALVGDGVVQSAQPNYRYVLAQDETPVNDEAEEGPSQETGENYVLPDDANQDEPTLADGNETSLEELQPEVVAEPNETLVEDSEPLEDANATIEEERTHTTQDDSESEQFLSVASATNDTYVGQQWGLELVQAAEAWKLAKANRSVTVAVIDSGCDTSHEDLKANMVAAYNVSTGTRNVQPSYGSASKHGTHVAGIISAVSDNKLGVSGVSYNARLMPIKVTDGHGNASTADIAKAFDYVIRHASTYNVRVINLSMCMEGSLQIDADLLARIDQAYSKGIVTVCAAGNSTASANGTVPFDCFPGDYDKAVSVINLRQSGNTVVRNSESNYNAAGTYGKDVSAPGTSIMSTTPTNEGGYGRLTGTSMAAPHVAGILALEFAANPSLSAQKAIDVLHATTVDLGSAGWDRVYGYGEANAYGAVYGAIHGMDAAQIKLIEQQRAKEAAAKEERAIASLQYRSCVQNGSFGSWRSKGATSGTTKSGLALEALQIELKGSPYSGGVQYRSRVGGSGWQAWEANGYTSGIMGEGKQIEAFKARLTGEMSKRYDIWYRVYVQKFGWSGWTKNGSSAGTVGYGYRIEAMQAKLVAKGSKAPGPTANTYRFSVKYQSSTNKSGWQSWRKNGSMSGSKKASAGMKAVRVKLVGSPYAGAITYRVRMKGTGWQGWRKNGAVAGSKGAYKRLGAVRIKLKGALASYYHVYYRVYARGYGWLGWAKNGAPAGTSGYAHPIDGIQVRIVERGSKAPGSTQSAYRAR